MISLKLCRKCLALPASRWSMGASVKHDNVSGGQHILNWKGCQVAKCKVSKCFQVTCWPSVLALYRNPMQRKNPNGAQEVLSSQQMAGQALLPAQVDIVGCSLHVLCTPLQNERTRQHVRRLLLMPKSGTHLENGFAVNSVPTKKGMAQQQGEASENLKVFEQKLTHDCRTLVAEYLADLGPRKGKSEPKG